MSSYINQAVSPLVQIIKKLDLMERFIAACPFIYLVFLICHLITSALQLISLIQQSSARAFAPRPANSMSHFAIHLKQGRRSREKPRILWQHLHRILCENMRPFITINIDVMWEKCSIKWSTEKLSIKDKTHERFFKGPNLNISLPQSRSNLRD